MIEALTMNYLSPEEFKDVYSKVTRLCVDLIITLDGGIILTRRSLPEWEHKWHLPGGTVTYKESVEQAVARIAQKELHMSVGIGQLLGYVEYPSEEKERGFGWTISIALLCVPKSPEFKVGEGATEAKVFTELPADMLLEQKEFLSTHWPAIIGGHTTK